MVRSRVLALVSVPAVAVAAGVALAAARAPIGVTPMIRQNDDPALDFTKIFTAYTG